MSGGIRGGSPPEEYDDEPEMLCKVTGTYCTGQFCEDYGCAKAHGIWDDEEGIQ